MKLKPVKNPYDYYLDLIAQHVLHVSHILAEHPALPASADLEASRPEGDADVDHKKNKRKRKRAKKRVQR